MEESALAMQSWIHWLSLIESWEGLGHLFNHSGSVSKFQGLLLSYDGASCSPESVQVVLYSS